MSESNQSAKVFWIDDGGEVYWYVAINAAVAVIDHLQLNYADAGVELDVDALEGLHFGQEAEGKELVIDGVSKPVKEWAVCETGFFGTTAL